MISGVTGEDTVLAEHVNWMRDRGLAASVIRRRITVLGWLGGQLDCSLLEATAEQVREWRSGLDVSADAAAVYISHVRQFYRWAAGRGLIAASPAAGLPAPRRHRRLPRPVGEQDLGVALLAAPARIRPWLILAGWAGLRACEIAGLRREHVLDTWAPPVLVIADGATKGHHERIVPMSAFVVAELRPVLPRNGWVFPRGDGQPGPNSPARVSCIANNYLHSLGITATLHQLRHRFATQAYQSGGRDLRAVQELLGHTTSRSTEGYAAYDSAAAAAAVDAIPAPGSMNMLKDRHQQPDHRSHGT